MLLVVLLGFVCLVVVVYGPAVYLVILRYDAYNLWTAC